MLLTLLQECLRASVNRTPRGTRFTVPTDVHAAAALDEAAAFIPLRRTGAATWMWKSWRAGVDIKGHTELGST